MESPLKEFRYRRQITLKGSEGEITGRLLGFLDWMESIPLIVELLKELRKAGGAGLLNEALFENEGVYQGAKKSAPDAQTIEQIASVGLALVEEARELKKNIHEFAWDFGIELNTRSHSGPIGGYVVPFLDYVEQRLPVLQRQPRGAELQQAPPAVIHNSLKRFHSAHRNAESTCFIMMRFGKTPAHSKIETAVKKALKKHSLVGLLARDREFHDDLFPNILTYVHGCAFGIAVFERVETNEFNPNVALEVGYMLGLRKQVLLLKDQTLKALHTDLVGKLYREFDAQKPQQTIPGQIDGWLSNKGFA